MHACSCTVPADWMFAYTRLHDYYRLLVAAACGSTGILRECYAVVATAVMPPQGTTGDSATVVSSRRGFVTACDSVGRRLRV